MLQYFSCLDSNAYNFAGKHEQTAAILENHPAHNKYGESLQVKRKQIACKLYKEPGRLLHSCLPQPDYTVSFPFCKRIRESRLIKGGQWSGISPLSLQTRSDSSCYTTDVKGKLGGGGRDNNWRLYFFRYFSTFSLIPTSTNKWLFHLHNLSSDSAIQVQKTVIAERG